MSCLLPAGPTANYNWVINRPTSAPLKLRPYGAIQICLGLYYYYYYYYYTDCTIAVSINLSAIKLRSATEGKDNVHSSRPANTMRVKRTRGLLTDRTPAGSGRSRVPHADCDTPGKSTAGRWSRYFATRTRLRVLFWDHYDVGARWSGQCHRPCKSFERGRNRFLRAFRLMAGVIKVG